MNIFELFGTIAVHNDEANKSIDATSKKAKDLQTKMDKAFDKIGDSAIKCGKAVVKGLTVISAAGATAVGALMKSSIGAYAEYEQLAGGVETLFKDSSDKVMAYANIAYKTAGLSANDYMSTVTSFSASLLQGLGGDTSAAAEMANMAITDMSDNANKMGTDMSMIQNAYQGFAKQNYTMLDNLKLGYGGTQAEMARLINDSGVLGDTMAVTAETVNQVSFAKMIEAIHVIQTEMGITGTTAKEASETISGSFNTWKATWTNLLTGMADDENIDPLIDTFFEAGQTVLQNVGKVIPKITANIGRAMQRLGTNVRTWMADTVWPFVQEYALKLGIELPSYNELESKVTNWWNNNALPAFANIESFFEDVGALMTSISDWCSENKGVVDAFFWALAIALAAVNLPLALLGVAIVLVAANWDTLKTAISNAWEAIKGFFTETIPQAWNDMVASVKTWWNDHVTTPVNNAIDAIGSFFAQTIPETWYTFVEDIKTKWGEVTEWIDNSAASILSFFGVDVPEDWSLIGSITDAWYSVVSAIQSAIDKVNEFFGIGGGGGGTESVPSAYKGGYGQGAGYGMGSEGGPGGASEIGFDDNGKPGLPVRGYATGLDFVPYNEMPARLHYGEAVLTREDAAAWRSGRAEDVSVLANRLESALDKLAGFMQQVVQNTAAGQNIVLDSGALVGQIAPRMDAQLGMMGARKARRG